MDLQFAVRSIFRDELGGVDHLVAHALLDEVLVNGVHGVFIHLLIRVLNMQPLVESDR